MRAASWPSRRKQRTGSPGAYGNVATSPRRAQRTASQRPRTRRTAASLDRGGSPAPIPRVYRCIGYAPQGPLPEEGCLRWAGDSKSDAAAWSLPGPVQTVYRAVIFAILVALEVFRSEAEVVSDCKGAVDEAERIRAGGAVSPTSRHADLWFRYKNALSAEGLGRVLVRWVPSHEKEDSDRISPEDRNGNGQADTLANALARRIGPTAKQGKLNDRRVRQMAAIQGIQLKILTASQASGPPKTQDRAQRGPGVARGCGHGPLSPRKCHLPTLEPGDLRMWGPHLIAPHGSEGYRCITCGRIPNHKRARYVGAQVLAVLGPLWPGGAPPPMQAQAQMEQGERGQMEAPRGGRPPGRQVQLHPARRQMALREARSPLRTCVSATSAPSAARGRQLARWLPRPSPMP